MLILSAIGLESLLQLDRFLRSVSAKRLLGTTRRIVASDWTITRVCKQFIVSQLKQLGIHIYKRLSHLGLVGIELGGKKLKVWVIDGSGVGSMLVSMLQVRGSVNLLLDVARIPKTGCELPTSFKLLREVRKTLGKGFVDLVVADGLYACQKFFNLCKEELCCDAVVKTSEIRLNIIGDAEGIFGAKHFKKEIEYREGVDETRYVSYRIWGCSGFEFEGVPYPIKVVKVEETQLKGKKAGSVTIFYVLTTAEYLSAWELKELAHGRWCIENNGFKVFNEQCHSKHIYTHDEVSFEVMLRIMMIGFNVVQAYRVTLEKEKTEWIRLAGYVKLPFKWLRHLFVESLGQIEASPP